MDSLRAVKSRDELDKIISAQRIAERGVLPDILQEIKPGVTEHEIAARLTYLHAALRRRKHVL